MTAYLIVRAEVPQADRTAFDKWYEAEHLPDAKQAFQVQEAQRGWSDVTPGVHIALYTFPSLARAREVQASQDIKDLIAEFDRVWQGRVTRTREVIEVKQRL
tara:strand:+ start:224 stop:529 length:306 start_codon:yes stop_codon:yes gene_type:complete